jgi:3',5'-cyclic-AMP phosphodiesterase
MHKLVWLSDPHLLAPGGVVCGRDPAISLEQAVRYVAQYHADAALCMLTGDLADDGSEAAYQHLRALLSPLSMPVLPLAGNHDDRARLIAALNPPVASHDGPVDYSVAFAGGLVVCLDSKQPGADSGWLTDPQLAWLEQTLRASSGQPAYIFCHHPPISLGLPALDRDRLLNGDALLRCLKGHANVRHLFFGHVHRPISGNIGGLPFTCLPSTAFQAPLPYPDWDWPSFQPTREPTAVGIILIQGDTTVVHFHQLEEPSA